MCRSMVDIYSATAEIRLGKEEEEEKEETTGHRYNVLICYAGRGHNESLFDRRRRVGRIAVR